MAVMNHIHLDLPTNLSAAPELAPTAIYTVRFDGRQPQLEVYASFNRAWEGTPYFAGMTDGAGNLRKFKNFKYTLRVTQAQLAVLETLLLSHVVLVDNVHCPNGQDHTNYIRHMRFMELKEDKPLEPMLQYIDVTITLFEEAESAAI